MHVFCCWQLFRFCIECVGIEDVVEYFRLEIFYGFVVCVVAVGSVCIVVVLLFCILQVVLVDSRILHVCGNNSNDCDAVAYEYADVAFVAFLL